QAKTDAAPSAFSARLRRPYIVPVAARAPPPRVDPPFPSYDLHRKQSVARNAQSGARAAMPDATIKAIRTTTLRVPWPQTQWLRGHPFGDTRDFLVLDLETSDGIVGMGYLFLLGPTMKTITAWVEETIAPRVLGKDATAVEGIWQDLWRASATYGRGGITTMAMSLLDIALWDALGKRAKLPLHRLWGHCRAQLPAYGSGCFRGSGGDGMIAKALHFKDRGYKAIKMQGAHIGDLHTDLAHCR